MAEAADEHVVPVKHKTCVLKASIHCEGCKRKVKKILSQIEGVEFVDVDTKQQKVTVVGDVEADTLLKKLVKSGKHAHLWPSEKSEKSERNSKIKEKQTTETRGKIVNHQQAPNPTSDSAPREKKPVVRAEFKSTNVQGSTSAAKIEEGSGGAAKSKEDCDGGQVGGVIKDAAVKTSGGKEKKKLERTDEGCSNGGEAGKVVRDAAVKTSGGEEKKKSERTDEGCSNGGEAPKKSNGSGDGVNGGGGVRPSGKKKKKTGQNGNTKVSEAATPARAESENNVHEPIPPLTTTHSPPRHEYYQPQHHYYSPPAPPVYGVSYNTAHPTSNYTASYYAAPPPYSYAYAYRGSETEPPPIQDPHPHPTQPLDSFEMFSDENPNGCSVA